MKWVMLITLLVASGAWASVFSNTLYYDAASAVDQLLISKGYEGQVVIDELSPGETCYWVYYPDRVFTGNNDDGLLMMTAFLYVGAVSRETSWASSLVFVVLRNKTFILPTSVARTAYELIEEDGVMDAMALIPMNTTDLETGTDDMGEAGVLPFSLSASTASSTLITSTSGSQTEEMIDSEYDHVVVALQSLEGYENTEWYDSDLQYYSLWLNGLQAERSGDMLGAIELYGTASSIQRFEMDNYEVLLPLGRALLTDGQTIQAQQTLETYLQRAQADLRGDNLLYGFTEEGMQALEANIANAEWLLSL